MAITLRYLPINTVSEPIRAFWNAASPDFFSTFAWLNLLTEHVFDQLNVAGGFLLAEEQGQIVGLCPVSHVINALGVSEWHSLSNYYSPIIKPLVVSNSLSALQETIIPQPSTKKEDIPSNQRYAGFLKAMQNGSYRWDIWTFRPVSQEDAFVLCANFKQAGTPAIPFYCFANWFLNVNGRSFEQYFSGLTARVRNTVLRKTKQFERVPESSMVIIDNENNLAQYITDYEAVYRESWKDDESFPAFIAELIQLAARQGSLRLGLAYAHNEPIAAQFWIVADGSAYIYKLAYKEKYKKYAAGTLLTAKLMQYVMDVDAVKTVDYLTGDDAYKQDWMSERRERWGVVTFNIRSFYGIVALSIEMPKYWLKMLFQRLRGGSFK